LKDNSCAITPVDPPNLESGKELKETCSNPPSGHIRDSGIRKGIESSSTLSDPSTALCTLESGKELKVLQLLHQLELDLVALESGKELKAVSLSTLTYSGSFSGIRKGIERVSPTFTFMPLLYPGIRKGIERREAK